MGPILVNSDTDNDNGEPGGNFTVGPANASPA